MSAIHKSCLLLASALSTPCAALGSYALHRTLVGEDFFSDDMWTFFTDADPTTGTVTYVNKSTAQKTGIIKAYADRVHIGPNLENIEVNGTIPSLRIQSKEVFNSTLIILSMTHQPAGCGVWPAVWMMGESPEHPWPRWGEADFLEGAHGQNEVWTTLHTLENCDQSDMKKGVDFTGTWQEGITEFWNKTESTNCSIWAWDQVPNEGCPITGPEASMGPMFNANGGGTFAFEWDPLSNRFQAFFWRLGEEPADIAAQKPVPENWGMPYAKFNVGTSKCPARLFTNMRLIVNTDFCGQWGQPEPAFHKACPQIPKDLTCPEYVTTYPQVLSEANWDFRRFDIYQRAKTEEPADIVM